MMEKEICLWCGREIEPGQGFNDELCTARCADAYGVYVFEQESVHALDSECPSEGGSGD